MQDDDRSPELSLQEQELFSSLSRDRLQAPPTLEDRVVAALKERGHIRPTSVAWQRYLPRIAAAMLILAMGFTVGRWTTAPSLPEPMLPRFMLLLYDTPEREATRTPEVERALAVEYSAWADEISRAGHFLAGDPIHGEGSMLRRADQRVERHPGAGTEEEIVVGYFLIQAEDYDQALKIAEGCPHLKYQGGVLVRRVGMS